MSFSYDENARHDIPIRPSVYRIRTDVEWDDVITSARSDRHRSSGKLGARDGEKEREMRGPEGRGGRGDGERKKDHA